MPKFRGERLRRVVIVEDVDADDDFRVQAVELYDDGAVVRWIIADYEPEWPSGDGDEVWPYLRLADDLGTGYHPGDGRAGGSPYRGETEFTPAVPLNATDLRVSWENGSVTVSLR